MKRKIRLLVIAALIMICPMLLCACSAPSEPTHSLDVSEGFSSINLDLRVVDARILPSQNGKTYVEGALRRGRLLSAEVTDGVLNVTVEDTRAWWQKLFSRSSAVTVYLAEGEYGALSLSGSTGDVEIGTGLSFGEVVIDISTGDVKLSSVRADALSVTVSTGHTELSDVSVAGDISLACSTGKTLLSGVTASSMTFKGSTGRLDLADITAMGAIGIERSTGDVTGARVAAATISAVAGTGDMSFTNVTTEGAFTVTTSTGKHTHTGIKAASIAVTADTGRVTLSDARTDGAINITTDTGDITLSQVLAGALMKLRADTGDVDLDRVDAAEIDIETDTGHVKGTILTEKIFYARSHSGKVSTPETTSGGKCKVVTDTGRIELRLAG